MAAGGGNIRRRWRGDAARGGVSAPPPGPRWRWGVPQVKTATTTGDADGTLDGAVMFNLPNGGATIW